MILLRIMSLIDLQQSFWGKSFYLCLMEQPIPFLKRYSIGSLPNNPVHAPTNRFKHFFPSRPPLIKIPRDDEPFRGGKGSCCVFRYVQTLSGSSSLLTQEWESIRQYLPITDGRSHPPTYCKAKRTRCGCR